MLSGFVSTSTGIEQVLVFETVLAEWSRHNEKFGSRGAASLQGHTCVTHSLFIDIQDVCIGMYIQLDIGWLRHPFPVSSFRISTQEQLQVLQSLGIASVRCIPAKSDPGISSVLPSFTNVEEDDFSAQQAASNQSGAAPVDPEMPTWLPAREDRETLVSTWSDAAALKNCNQQFSVAAHGYRQVVEELQGKPEQAMETSSNLVAGYIAELLDAPHTVIRLLSERVGEQQGAHPVNVTILSLLLGKAHGLNSGRLLDLGLAAFLHDVGKIDVDPRCVEASIHFTPEQLRQYQGHVGASVAYGQRMGLSPGALTAIAQHHEAADGSGFPLSLVDEDLTIEGQILALTNCYDKLCNPSSQTAAMTPHEALSALFAQRRGAFAREMVELFVRVMGVYPPGSIVQLSDERYGVVVAVHGARPLKPRVLLYSREVGRVQAHAVELSEMPEVVIKRSLRPAQLPREVLDYLSPCKRVCYFFERAVPLEQGES